MKERPKKLIIVLFVIRVCLWIIALASTIYWIYYSIKLHRDGIFAPDVYSPMLRPVLYMCLCISIVAICISFALHAWTVRIKKQNEQAKEQKA